MISIQTISYSQYIPHGLNKGLRSKSSRVYHIQRQILNRRENTSRKVKNVTKIRPIWRRCCINGETKAMLRRMNLTLTANVNEKCHFEVVVSGIGHWEKRMNILRRNQIETMKRLKQKEWQKNVYTMVNIDMLIDIQLLK